MEARSSREGEEEFSSQESRDPLAPGGRVLCRRQGLWDDGFCLGDVEGAEARHLEAWVDSEEACSRNLCGLMTRMVMQFVTQTRTCLGRKGGTVPGQ